MVPWFLCKCAHFPLSSEPCIPRGLVQGGAAFEGHTVSVVSFPCRAVAANVCPLRNSLTYICPSRNSFLNSESCLKMAGEKFNFLHIVDPRRMSLVSALKEFLFSQGRNLRQWRPQVFLLAPASPTLCNTEVFCSLEHKGYEKILWPVQFGDQWPCRHGNCVIRASLVTDCRRQGSVSGSAPESSLPNP